MCGNTEFTIWHVALVFSIVEGPELPKASWHSTKKVERPCYYNVHMSVNFVILSDLHVYAHFLFVLLSVHLCIILDTPSTRVTCPAGWSMFGTSCYTTFQQQLSWMNASVTTPSAPSQHLSFEDGSLKLYIDFKNNTVALIFFVFLLRWSAWHTVQNLSK